MGLFDWFKKSKKDNSSLRVSWDETEDVGIITQYKGKPFTGVCYELHTNGNVKEECEMVKGLKHGKEHVFSSEGKLMLEINLKDDKKNGVFKLYREDGTLDTEGNYKDDNKDGVFKLYREDKTLETEGNFMNGKREGIWKKYNADGVLEYESSYKDDIEKDRKNNPDLPLFYGAQKVIDEGEARKVQMPTAPIDENKDKDEVEGEVKYEFQKNASEFESIKDIIDFLKSNKDINIRVDAHENWDGYCQLSNDKQSETIKHHNLYKDGGDVIVSFTEKLGKQEVYGNYSEGYDLKKQAYEEDICIWAEGFANKEFIINELNQFIEEAEGNTSETIYEFYDFLDIPQESWQVMELFEVTDVKSGSGREEGVDEFSWHAESYVRSAGVDLIFCKRKLE